MRVMAIDPGITTGWAVGDAPFFNDGNWVFGAGEVAALEVGRRIGVGPKETAESVNRGMLYASERLAVDVLAGMVEDYAPDVLVVEDFVVYEHKATSVSTQAGALAPVRIGAMLAYVAAECGCEIEYQMASMGKTTVTNERLKRWGLWQVGKPHARDAIRHLVTYLRRFENGEVEPIQWG